MSKQNNRSADAAAQKMLDRAAETGVEIAWDRWEAMQPSVDSANSECAAGFVTWGRAESTHLEMAHRPVFVEPMLIQSSPATWFG